MKHNLFSGPAFCLWHSVCPGACPDSSLPKPYTVLRHPTKGGESSVAWVNTVERDASWCHHGFSLLDSRQVQCEICSPKGLLAALQGHLPGR